MTKEQMQKLSVLGLVLIVASAIVAFIMPKANKKVYANGHIQLDSTSVDCHYQASCRTGVIIGLPKCDYTATDNALSFTTVGDASTSADGVTTHDPGCSNTGLHDNGNNTLVTNP